MHHLRHTNAPAAADECAARNARSAADPVVGRSPACGSRLARTAQPVILRADALVAAIEYGASAAKRAHFRGV
jgi:hypothetical protein